MTVRQNDDDDDDDASAGLHELIIRRFFLYTFHTRIKRNNFHIHDFVIKSTKKT